MIKIAIPTSGNLVDSHFGHCEMYTVISADDNLNVTGTEILPSPHGCGCKSDIADQLASDGVTHMLAGGIGDGAMNVLNGRGINVIRGCSGDATEVVKLFLSGLVEDSGTGCNHTEGHHHHHEHEGHHHHEGHEGHHHHHHEEGHVCNHEDGHVCNHN